MTNIDFDKILETANKRLAATHQIWYDNGSGWFELDQSKGIVSFADASQIINRTTEFGYLQIAVEVGQNPNKSYGTLKND